MIYKNKNITFCYNGLNQDIFIILKTKYTVVINYLVKLILFTYPINNPIKTTFGNWTCLTPERYDRCPRTSNCVVQLCVQICVHLVDGIYSGRVINQELTHIYQTVLLFHFLSFRQSLEEV